MDIITIPFSWVLLNLYLYVGNYGLAILIFALLVRLIMLPFQMKSKRSMMRSSRLSPKLKELEKRFEGNRRRYQEEVSKIYKEENINPMSGCLWSLIPFPILIALYSVIRQPLTSLMRLSAEQITLITDKLVSLGLYTIPEKAGVYDQVALANLVHENLSAVRAVVPEVIDVDFSFIGLNLGYTPDIFFFTKVDWSVMEQWLPALGLFLIPVISGGLAFIQMKISNNANPQASEQMGNMKGMLYMMPLISVYIGFIMPAALGIYWIAGNIIAIFQDLWLNRRYGRILDAEEAERNERFRLREEELERKRLETERLRSEGATSKNPNTSKRKRQVQEKVKHEERVASAIAAARPAKEGEKPASQVGKRRYARGRAYVPDRYTNPETAGEATLLAAAESQNAESVEPDGLMEPPETPALPESSLATDGGAPGERDDSFPDENAEDRDDESADDDSDEPAGDDDDDDDDDDF